MVAMNKQKGFILLLLILLVIAAAVIALAAYRVIKTHSNTGAYPPRTHLNAA